MANETSVRTSTLHWFTLVFVALTCGCVGVERDEGAGDTGGDAGHGDTGIDAATSGTRVDAATGGTTSDAATDTDIDADVGETDADVGTGTCCPDGDCLCHGPAPTVLTSSNGPFATAQFTIPTGKVYYPTDAEPPFAAVAICGGNFNTGPEMAPWGPFYASHGIVVVVVTTGLTDQPPVRATKLLAAIEGLKDENTDAASPLHGTLSGRYGTSGYSFGGGATTRASASDPTLRTSVALAPYAGVGTGVQVPTLLLCGKSDSTAPCSMAQGDYGELPSTTPKMMVSIPGATHFSWFGPTNAGNGLSGAYALAFQKVFLEGDERWRPLLLTAPTGGAAQTTNIAP